MPPKKRKHNIANLAKAQARWRAIRLAKKNGEEVQPASTSRHVTARTERSEKREAEKKRQSDLGTNAATLHLVTVEDHDGEEAQPESTSKSSRYIDAAMKGAEKCRAKKKRRSDLGAASKPEPTSKSAIHVAASIKRNEKLQAVKRRRIDAGKRLGACNSRKIPAEDQAIQPLEEAPMEEVEQQNENDTHFDEAMNEVDDPELRAIKEENERLRESVRLLKNENKAIKKRMTDMVERETRKSRSLKMRLERLIQKNLKNKSNADESIPLSESDDML